MTGIHPNNGGSFEEHAEVFSSNMTLSTAQIPISPLAYRSSKTCLNFGRMATS